MSLCRRRHPLHEVYRRRSLSVCDQRLRGLHAEALEDRRLLSVTGQTSNDEILTALAGMATAMTDEVPAASAMLAAAEPLSFQLTALDDYVAAPDSNYSFSVVRTFAATGIDGYVLKLTSQEWRTTDEVNRTLWEHWLIVAVPKTLSPDSTSALLAITGGNNRSTTPPSGFSEAELGTIAYLTNSVVAELRMVPNQPLSFSADGEAAGTFFVPGDAPEQVDLPFRFDSAWGGYSASFGYYDVNSVSADPVLEKRDYAVQAITNGTLLFDERVHYWGTTTTVSLPAGTELGFYIIPDDTVANFLADPDAYYGGGRRAPLFSLPAANPGQFDQMVASIQGGVTRLGFEDLSRVPGGGSNEGFNDVQISIDVELVPAPVPPGTDFFGIGRTEDEIIAYTFDQYMVTGDDTWPALLPMVKSAVRAMDAVQQFVPTVTGGKQIDDFVVTGGSKRGWTTWLTAVADAASADPRVKAIIPIVFDVLNLDEQLEHHKEYYEGVTNSIIDGYSNALEDYTSLDVIERIDTPEGQELLKIIDPYEYLDRLTMPKFMINSTGDEFFVPDSGQFYLGDLPGQNYVRYVPNTNHDVLDNSDAAESLVAYYNAIINDLPLPQFSWTVEDGGTTIRVETSDTPLFVTMWQATNYGSNDYRRSVTGIPWSGSPLVDLGGGVYEAHVAEPNLGSTAFLVEMTFPGTIFPFKFTSRVSVLQADEESPVEPWLVPELVDDVNDQTFGTSFANLTEVNGTLFFTSYDSAHGSELWKSNGTAAGTVRVADLFAGPGSSYPTNLTNVGGTLFFVAYDSQHGRELWKSDGTAEGTLFVADMRPNSNYGYVRSSDPENLTAVGGTLFFTAYDDEHGRELWKSDGTAEGTMLVADIFSGSSYGSPSSSSPWNLTAVGGTLFFTARDSEHGTELWKSDGTSEGTMLVADIYLGTTNWGQPLSSYPTYLTAVGGTLFFRAYEQEHGWELWKSDGTAEGTVLIKDIRPNASSYGYGLSSYPSQLTTVGGLLFFTAVDDEHGRELWKSDGTAEGTVLVRDVNPGDSYGSPFFSDPVALVNVGGILYFSAYDNEHGRELWKSDGTSEGTVLLVNIVADSPYGSRSSYPSDLTDVGGRLFFVAYSDEYGPELWTSDGTSEGTLPAANIRSEGLGYPRGSYPNLLTAVGGKLFFAATDDEHGQELWNSDGTADGTKLVKDIASDTAGSQPYELTDINGTLFFTAQDVEHGRELWKTDGTAAGATLVADIIPGPSGSSPWNLTNVGGTLFFTAGDNVHGYELWKSDSTAEGTVLVKDIRPSSPYGYAFSSDPQNLVNVGGILYFTAYDDDNGRELWKSDGTEEGTILVADIFTDSPYGWSRSSYPNNLTAVGATLFFTAHDEEHGRELWKTDGTTEGTMLVADISPGSSYGNPRSSYPTYLTDVGGTLFFRANDEHGSELWKSDGTTEGTMLVKDILPGSPYGYARSSSPSYLTNVGGTLFFQAYDIEHGNELWKSDGTAEGTTLVKDIYTGGSSAALFNLTNVNGTLFFAANHPSIGRELWTSDGTDQGTVPLKDIWPGYPGSYATELTELNGLLFFRANDGQHGNTLWQSDGTAAGTVRLPDPTGSSASTYPWQLTNVGGTLFFTANETHTGREPWMLVQPVEIDIRPNDTANNVNPTSNGKVPVALLSSQTFDAGLVDPATLTLAGAPLATSGNGTPSVSLEDVNGDGLLDLLLQFVAKDLQLPVGATSAMLEGKLTDGQRIRGSDLIHIVGPAANPNHGNNGNNGNGNGNGGNGNGGAPKASQGLQPSVQIQASSMTAVAPLETFNPSVTDQAIVTLTGSSPVEFRGIRSQISFNFKENRGEDLFLESESVLSEEDTVDELAALLPGGGGKGK